MPIVKTKGEKKVHDVKENEASRIYRQSGQLSSIHAVPSPCSAALDVPEKLPRAPGFHLHDRGAAP
jgi:hypothetical protein